MKAALVALVLSLSGLIGSTTLQDQPPVQSYACARFAPEGLPDYPHTCALVRPYRDGTADLWLQRRGVTYERCTVAEPYNPPGAYCR